MEHNLDYWNNPRGSIAVKYKNNDFAYATSGGMGALGAVSFLPVPANQLKTFTMLDYGCGTGRVTRPLSMIFKGVFGYDPNKACIEEFAVENDKADYRNNNVVFSHNFADVPEVDYACCINVIEHLSKEDAQVVIDNLKAKVRYGTVMVYSVKDNWDLISPYLSKEDYETDLLLRENGGNISVRLINIK